LADKLPVLAKKDANMDASRYDIKSSLPILMSRFLTKKNECAPGQTLPC